MDKETATSNVKVPAPAVLAEQPASAKKTSPRRADKKGPYFYIGPTLHGLIRHGDMFRGSKTEVKDAIAKFPEVKTLLVSAEAFPSARLRVKQPGNALYASYQKIVRAARVGEEKEA